MVDDGVRERRRAGRLTAAALAVAVLSTAVVFVDVARDGYSTPQEFPPLSQLDVLPGGTATVDLQRGGYIIGISAAAQAPLLRAVDPDGNDVPLAVAVSMPPWDGPFQDSSGRTLTPFRSFSAERDGVHSIAVDAQSPSAVRLGVRRDGAVDMLEGFVSGLGRVLLFVMSCGMVAILLLVAVINSVMASRKRKAARSVAEPDVVSV